VGWAPRPGGGRGDGGGGETRASAHFNLQRPDTHATLSCVFPLSSHFDSPHTASHGTGGLPASGTALQVQQSEKMMQSLSFWHWGSVDSGAASSCAMGLGPSSGFDSRSAEAAAGSAAGAVGAGVDFDEPPHAAAAITRTKTETVKFRRHDMRAP
jgi:hypothetical protein